MIEPTPRPDAVPSVVLHLPAHQQYARVAHNVVIACGVLVDLTVEQIDDVRLLIDEAFHALLHVNTGPITMRLTVSRLVNVELSVRLRTEPVWDLEQLEWVDALAEMVATTAELVDDGDLAVFRATIDHRP